MVDGEPGVGVVEPVVERGLQDEEDIHLLSPSPLLIGNLGGSFWLFLFFKDREDNKDLDDWLVHISSVKENSIKISKGWQDASVPVSKQHI